MPEHVRVQPLDAGLLTASADCEMQRILGRLAERHFVAAVAALERHDANAVQLRQLEETLDALEGEAGA